MFCFPHTKYQGKRIEDAAECLLTWLKVGDPADVSKEDTTRNV